MSIYVWWPKIPDTYQEVEYIESDGTAYMQIGFTAYSNPRMELTISNIAQGSAYKDSNSYIVFGTAGNSWRYSCTYYTYNWNRFRYHLWNWSKQYYDRDATASAKNTLVFNFNNFMVNWAWWNLAGTDSSWSDTNSNYIHLWHCGNGSFSKYRLYNLKLVHDGVLYEYIPCYRKSDNKIWLWGITNSTFITNANSSGNFTKWADVTVHKVNSIALGASYDYSNMQWPCSAWYHVWTQAEWKNIVNAGITLGAWVSGDGTNFWKYMKMPFCWYRNYNRNIYDQWTWWRYWLNTFYKGTNGNNWNSAYFLNIGASTLSYASVINTTCGHCIRPIKDEPKVPDSTRNTLFSGSGWAWIFWKSALWLISISANGTTRYTIADKNVWATSVWSYGDALSAANCGNYFQRWNNYPYWWTWTPSSTYSAVDAASYWPWNYYSSSTWSTARPREVSANPNLWWSISWLKWNVKSLYLWTTKVRPKREPWANTVAYYPLTATTTINDKKPTGTKYNLTNWGNVAFGTYQWVSCAYFNGTSNSKLYNTSVSFSAYPTQTVCFRVYINSTSTSVYQILHHIWTSSPNGKLWSWFKYDTWLAISSWNSSYESVKSWNITWAWHLITNVTNWNSSIQYLDGWQYQIFTNSLTAAQSQLYIGSSQSSTSERLTGYESEFIVENRPRTAEEVWNYYNWTKGNYWIS